MFKLHKALEEKIHVTELPTSIIKFEHQYKACPWLLVIPKIENKGNFTDLTLEEQQKLMVEVALASEVMEELFRPDRLNIAMIGNKTPQLHVHVICRYENDPNWPDTIWNKSVEPMSKREAETMVTQIKALFAEKYYG